MLLTFSNPRRKAVFTDWPLNRFTKGVCTFEVHSEGKKGERISRVTTGKPKFTTYCTKAAIVDGSNGKTYLLLYSSRGDYASVRIAASDMQYDAPEAETGLMGAHVSLGYKQDALFAELKALIDAAV